MNTFSSFPDRVIVARFQASKAGALTFRASLHTEHPTAKVESLGNTGLVMRGQVPGLALRRTLEWVERRGEQWKNPELWDSTGRRRPFAKPVLYGAEGNNRGTFFDTRFEVNATGASVAVQDGVLEVQGAQEVLFILSAASSYNGPQKSPSREGADPALLARQDMTAAKGKGFPQLKARHLQDYHALFRRTSLDLGSSGTAGLLPTDERIARFNEGHDPSLAPLYLQFARYLTISGSRAGTQPLNLQGIWNKDVISPWASGYTTNINVEMNYWPGRNAQSE